MDPTGRAQDTPPQPQVLSLGRKDTRRLLEVYVQRSLSFNDERAGGQRRGAKPRQWVPLQDENGRFRRHSSDSSAHIPLAEVEAVVAGFKPASPDEDPGTGRPLGPRLESSTDAPADGPIGSPAVPRLEGSAELKQGDREPKKGPKKVKKPSILKSFLNLFSRKGSDKRSSSPERLGALAPLDTPSPSISCLPAAGPSLGADHPSPRSGRTLRKKLSRRKFSFRHRGADQPRGSLKKPNTLALSEPVHMLDAVSVDPTSLYYEKVSEELEKIVKEVKDSPTDEHRIFDQSPESLRTKNAKEAEAIEKIIYLLKQQGDAIDEELKLSESGAGFFQTLSYGAFQQLADLYVESGTPGQPPQGPPTAPELVKFAFSLDFTAKVAGLSSQTLGRIMGFGNQYLQDRFTQMNVSQQPESQSRQAQTFSGPD